MGRFIVRNAAYQPWIWTAGNHELDFAPQLEETTPFKSYMHRYYAPYASSHSTSPLCMVEPQPGFSAYREASFGHGIFDIKNRTHAYLGTEIKMLLLSKLILSGFTTDIGTPLGNLL
ncbi:hypothetical protein V6N12_040430 [Hibiscus sabdariffa]|uniref:Purple acid phosphatase C-terminal domain-containing protein n=1 Tax=Hibiscus sabdariffa TaxID=183260 RepID=A0ABR2E3N8_9ROSI